MRPDRRHPPSPLGDPATVVNGIEAAQQFGGRGHRHHRRRLQQRQTGTSRRTPRRQVEGEACQIGDRDLRRRMIVEMRVVGGRPAPIDPARRLPPGATRSLVGRRSRNPAGDQRT